MASRNSLLLIIKQNPGITYTALLANILGDYSNINSARAALSRTLKDLEALGLVRKKNSAIFITDKGLAMLQLEMKNKLILKLNEVILKEQAPEELVKDLSILVQRSKEDRDLLEVAKKSANFYVSDIEKKHKALEKKIKQLNYLNAVLKKQIGVLKKLGFRDRAFFEKKFLSKILDTIIKKERPAELVVTSDEKTLNKLSELLKTSIQSNSIIIAPEELPVLLSFLDKGDEKATIMFQDFQIKIAERCEIIAPANKIAFIKL